MTVTGPEDPVGWTIRPAAEEDLAAIWTAGVADWGAVQADRYIDTLFAVFDLLAAFPQMARERAELRPGVRIHPSGAHLVIYRQIGPSEDAQAGAQPGGPQIEVIRLLHAHQDLTAYLAAEGP